MTLQEFFMHRYRLGFYVPIKTQQESMEYLIKNVPDEYIPYLITQYADVTYENAVYVLRQIGMPRNLLALDGLFFLISDINRHGALEAFDLLKEIYSKYPDKVQKQLEKSLLLAINNNDGNWITWIQLFVKECNIRKNNFFDVTLYDVLEKK